MKQSKKLLTNKILFSGLLILIQLIIVFVAFLTIHRSSRFFVYLFKLISVLAALYIINKDDASAYKITWLVLIAAVPFVGGVLYVFLGDKKPSQRLQLAFLKQIKNQRIIENDIIEEVGIKPDQKTATRFIIHVCCMIERLMKGETLPYRGWEDLKKREEKVFSAIEDKFVFIQYKFGVTVPPEEISYLVELFLAEMAQ